MTVVLNPAAMAALFESPPVVAFVERTADRVVAQAQQNVKDYFGTAPSLHGRVDQDVDTQMEGSSAVIGVKDAGNKARRLAAKQADGTFPWLTRALASVRG